MNGHRTKQRRNITENFNSMNRLRYRRQTDDRRMGDADSIQRTCSLSLSLKNCRKISHWKYHINATQTQHMLTRKLDCMDWTWKHISNTEKNKNKAVSELCCCVCLVRGQVPARWLSCFGMTLWHCYFVTDRSISPAPSGMTDKHRSNHNSCSSNSSSGKHVNFTANVFIFLAHGLYTTNT